MDAPSIFIMNIENLTSEDDVSFCNVFFLYLILETLLDSSTSFHFAQDDKCVFNSFLSSLDFRFAQVPTDRLGHAQLRWSRLSP